MSESYERDLFLVAYLRWHYGRGLREFFGVAGNFLWFISHFFSFKLLFKTLFAPWKRLGEKYEGGLDLGAFASSMLINAIMRAFGLVTKVIVIVVGLASYLAALLFSFFVLCLWLLMPAVLLGSAVLSATFFVV